MQKIAIVAFAVKQLNKKGFIMSSFTTSNEVVYISNENFVSNQQLGFENKEVAFSQKIHWLLESESTIKFMHGGMELKTGSTFNDFYGYLESCSVDDLKSLAENYSVDENSSLEIVMETKVFIMPVVLTDADVKYNNEKKVNYKCQYTRLPKDFKQKVKQTNVEFAKEQPFIYSELVDREIATEVVLTTNKTEAENEKNLSTFKKRYSVDAVSDLVNMSISDMLKEQ